MTFNVRAQHPHPSQWVAVWHTFPDPTLLDVMWLDDGGDPRFKNMVKTRRALLDAEATR